MSNITFCQQIVKSKAMITINRILVPMDFSHSARYSLDIAVDLAEKFEAQIYLLYVFEMPFDYPLLLNIEMDESELYTAIQAEMDEALNDLVRQFSRPGIPINHFLLKMACLSSRSSGRQKSLLSIWLSWAPIGAWEYQIYSSAVWPKR